MKNNITKNEIFGGNLFDAPNDKYAKFFGTFKEIDILEISQWKPSHLLGYFCKKYKDIYNTDYKFKFNSPSPIKSFEVFQIKKLAMLLTSNPQLLKDYIDWVFENKVIKAKRKLTSISFMTNEHTINEYKMNVLLAGKKNLNVSRSTELPQKFKDVFKQIGVNVNTYGELSFISKMDSISSDLLSAMDKIEKLGFDKQILERII